MRWWLRKALVVATLSSNLEPALAEPSEATPTTDQPVPAASFPTEEKPTSPPRAPPPISERPTSGPPSAAPRGGESAVVARQHEPPPDRRTTAYRPEYLDYRGYLAAADGVALGLLIGAFAAENEWLALGGAVTYVLGGPAVHAGNGQPIRGAASLGLRLGLPVVGMFGGGLVGAALCEDTGSSETRDGDLRCLPPTLGGVIVGMLVGAVGAMVVDDVFLGKVELPRGQSARLRPTLTALGPIADPSRKVVGLRLAGTF
jgi:hypothetical protein